MEYLCFSDLLHIQGSLLAQASVLATPSPTPNASSSIPMNLAELQLLKSQLEFLKDSNVRLSTSFSQFIEAMKFVLVALGVLGGVIVYIFGKNLDDAKTLATQAIQQKVEGHVSSLVQVEVENLKRSLDRERIISEVFVDYYLPKNLDTPSEVKLLKARGFKEVRCHKNLQSLMSVRSDIVVLDLEHAIVPKSDDLEQQAKLFIDDLLNILSPSSVVIIYIRGYVKYINTLTERYVIAANNPITLVGNVTDGAYVVMGDRS
jgi:hypothetical protein